MTHLFLSYGRGDDVEPFDPASSFLARLHRELAAAGFDVWFDRLSMPSRRLTFHQEIRDAIAAADRVVLVVGPHAVRSDYVRQEWQFALKADKVVTPTLRRGDFPLVPANWGGAHCEDFRDDAQHSFHLANLFRQLREPIPLGRLLDVPALPPHFLARPDRLAPLTASLRADLDRPVVLSGATARVGVHGMGGIGKSVLAAAVARERRIREAFPDGVVWITLGQRPDVPALLRRVHLALGGDGAFADAQARSAPTAAVAVLWSHTGELDDWSTDELLAVLRERSLLSLATAENRPCIELHDLIHDYLRRATPDARPLHAALLAGYSARCPDGWPTGPDDGYFFTHLRAHLKGAERAAELPFLVRDHRWLEAKAAAGVVTYRSPDSGVAEGQGRATHIVRIALESDQVGRGEFHDQVKLGMAGQADIVTGEESLLGLLVKRIRQTISLK